MKKSALFGALLALSSLSLSAGNPGLSPLEEDLGRQVICAYVTPKPQVKDNIESLKSLVKLNNGEAEVSIITNPGHSLPIPLSQLFGLKTKDPYGQESFLTSNELLMRIATHTAEDSTEQSIVVAAQKAWGHRPFYIDGENVHSAIEKFGTYKFLTYPVLGPGLELHPEYWNILFTSRNLTGFGYDRVMTNPMMGVITPQDFINRHVNTLHYFHVNASPFFKAGDLRWIPFTVRSLTLMNQSDIRWDAFAYLPPSLESLTLLHCPNVTKEKPVRIQFPEKLRSLTVSYQGADDAFFEMLPQSLRSLTLYGAQCLTKDSVSKLKPGLQFLRLEYCNASGPDPLADIPSTSERLEVLNSSGINADDLNTISNRGGATLFIEGGEYSRF